MAVSMAAFTMNDAITKAVSSQMNFGQVMLVRGLFAIVLIAALALHQRALRPLRSLMMTAVVLRGRRNRRNDIVPGGDRELASGQYHGDPSGAATCHHARRSPDVQ